MRKQVKAVTSDCIWNTVVNLKIAFVEKFTCKSIALPVNADQLTFETFRKRPATAKSTAFDVVEIAESVCTDLPTIFFTNDAMAKKRDTIFFDVLKCAWRMRVPIDITQVLIGNDAVLQNVINDYARALRCNAFAEFHKSGRKRFFRRKCDV